MIVLVNPIFRCTLFRAAFVDRLLRDIKSGIQQNESLLGISSKKYFLTKTKEHYFESKSNFPGRHQFKATSI